MTGRRRALVLGAFTMTLHGVRAHAAELREEEADVVVHGVEVKGRITHPAQAARGALLLLPGSLYSDVDGNYPSMNLWPHVYADLARQLAQRGVVVMRMAKIGPGTGSRTLDAAQAVRHLDFAARIDVAAAGLACLRQSTDRRPCVVAGHSEGALVAAKLAVTAAGAVLDGVASLSGPAQPLLSLWREQTLRTAPAGTTPDLAVLDETLDALRGGRALPAAARLDPHAGPLAAMPAPAHVYLRSVDQVDPRAVWSRVAQPALIVHGERDDSVPPAHAQALWQARSDRPTRLVRVPGLTHFYKLAPPGLHPGASMALTAESDPAVAEALVAWMGELPAPAR